MTVRSEDSIGAQQSRDSSGQRGFWQLPGRRLVAFIVLLVVEFFVLSILLDTASLDDVQYWWVEIVRELPHLSRISIAAGAAILLFAAPLFGDIGSDLAQRVGEKHRLRPFLICGHLFAYTCFAGVAIRLFNPVSSSSSAGWFVLICLVATFLVLLGTWGAALAPTRGWFKAIRRGLGPMLIAALIGVLVWATGRFTIQMWLPLSVWTLDGVRLVLHVFTSDVVFSASDLSIGTSRFEVQIATSCSGYEGIGLIWTFLGLYFWFYRKALRFPHVFLLVPLGTIAIWLANVVRIAGLIMIGTCMSGDVARGGFHSLAGWLVFNALALGMVALSIRCRFFASESAASVVSREPNPTIPYLAPFLTIVAMTMVTGAFSVPGELDWYYPLRVFAVVVVLWCFRREYLKWDWSWSWHSIALGACVSVIWVVLTSFHDAPPTTPWMTKLAGLPTPFVVTWFGSRVLGYVVTVPLAEELAFRGYLTRRLISSDFQALSPGQFSWMSFLISSLLFGLLHGTFWIAGCLAGLLFAIAFYRRGRIADAVVAHATANTLLAIYAVVTGSWHVWS